MPRRAIISDIHGNLLALEAVLDDIRGQNVKDIICLGDICGYGPEPVECIELIRKSVAWTLKGNHDEAIFVEPEDFSRTAIQAIHWQRTILKPEGANCTPESVERWTWLQNLPAKRVEDQVMFVHASPKDPLYEYVLKEDFDNGEGPSQKAKDMFAAMDWLAFCGHSHRPGIVAEDYKWHIPADLDQQSSIIKRGFKTIVNIGSVGQPRDENPNACYVIFDYDPPEPIAPGPQKSGTSSTMMIPVKQPEAPKAPEPAKELEETRFGHELQLARDTALLKMPRITFRRVPYDIAAAQARFKAVKELPAMNGERLALGK